MRLTFETRFLFCPTRPTADRPGHIRKKRSSKRTTSRKSGYCDSNTGPSGPKPDALANCATPR